MATQWFEFWQELPPINEPTGRMYPGREFIHKTLHHKNQTFSVEVYRILTNGDTYTVEIRHLSGARMTANESLLREISDIVLQNTERTCPPYGSMNYEYTYGGTTRITFLAQFIDTQTLNTIIRNIDTYETHGCVIEQQPAPQSTQTLEPAA